MNTWNRFETEYPNHWLSVLPLAINELLRKLFAINQIESFEQWNYQQPHCNNRHKHSHVSMVASIYISNFILKTEATSQICKYKKTEMQLVFHTTDAHASSFALNDWARRVCVSVRESAIESTFHVNKYLPLQCATFYLHYTVRSWIICSLLIIGSNSDSATFYSKCE